MILPLEHPQSTKPLCMIGGEGGAFQAPQQRVGGGNTGSNEGRGAGTTMVALGSYSVLFEGFYLLGTQPRDSVKLLYAAHGENRGWGCPDRMGRLPPRPEGQGPEGSIKKGRCPAGVAQ